MAAEGGTQVGRGAPRPNEQRGAIEWPRARPIEPCLRRERRRFGLVRAPCRGGGGEDRRAARGAAAAAPGAAGTW